MHKTFFAMAAAVTVVIVGTPGSLASTGAMFVTADTRLVEDHFGPVFITSPDVTFDCAGHAVIGDQPGGSFREGIHVLAADVTVTNCVVRNFVTGIFTDVQGTRIVNNTLSRNSEAIRLQGTTDGVVVGNTATDNDWWGILVCCHASDNTITGNTAEANHGVGMTLNDVSNNEFSNNVSNHNPTGYGIGLGSSHNTIEHNVASNSIVSGFDFLDANDSTIEANVSVHNGSGPIGGGFSFNNSSRNTVTGNIAMNDGSTGFNVFFGSELNLFTDNHACRNFYVDALDNSWGAGNTWAHNYFCNSILP